MKYSIRLWFIKFYWYIIGLIELLIILGCGWFFGHLIETAITTATFFILRPCYEKQFHAKTLGQCFIISIIVMGVVSAIEIPMNISIFASIIMALLLTIGSYYVRDYIDIKAANKKMTAFLTEGNRSELIALIDKEVYFKVFGTIKSAKLSDVYYKLPTIIKFDSIEYTINDYGKTWSFNKNDLI